MPTVQLGELLVRHGALTPEQRDAVLDAQRTRGGPFGALAEEMFGVSQHAVERAWAEQYSTIAARIDPRTCPISQYALEIISRRQAWQFAMLPISINGDEVVACTAQEFLVRALKFAGWRLGHSCHFLLCDAQALGEALEIHYPMAGMTAESLLEHRAAV